MSDRGIDLARNAADSARKDAKFASIGHQQGSGRDSGMVLETEQEQHEHRQIAAQRNR